MGITAQHNTVLFDQAYQLMRRHARNNNSRPRQRRRGDRCGGPSGL